jgi:uncharacterized coiled-coil protein SlyX
MNASTLCLRPNTSEKLNSFFSKSDEALFLIELRLKEIALLVPLKQSNVLRIRWRLASRDASPRLESELAEQQEQIQDLTQLAEDWLNIAQLISQHSTSLDDLSEPIKRMLRSLGLNIPADLAINAH